MHNVAAHRCSNLTLRHLLILYAFYSCKFDLIYCFFHLPHRYRCLNPLVCVSSVDTKISFWGSDDVGYLVVEAVLIVVTLMIFSVKDLRRPNQAEEVTIYLLSLLKLLHSSCYVHFFLEFVVIEGCAVIDCLMPFLSSIHFVLKILTLISISIEAEAEVIEMDSFLANVCYEVYLLSAHQ